MMIFGYIRKKSILCMLVIAVAFILCGNTKNTSAQSVFNDEAGFYYTENVANGTYNVAAYNGTDMSVTIPSYFNGGEVVSVLTNAFSNKDITDVYIPDTVKTLGDNAFGYCTKLKNVRLSAKLTSIPIACFSNCKLLKAISIPVSCTQIGYDAFASCTSLYQISVSKAVKVIASSAFEGCNKNILTVVAPKSSYSAKFAKKYGIMTTTTKSAKLSSKSRKMIIKEKIQLYLYNSPQKPKWKSNHSSIVSVNSKGKITAKKNGKATITAVCGTKSYKCSITVKTKTVNSMLRVIYSQYVKDSMSDYEKIVAAHKWLIQNVKYDKRLYTKGDVPWVSHTARGALKYGIAVCDGYSKAFMMIMEHYNIPCMMVTGGQHAWNLVKIKNKWYHVDCTFDDPIVNWSFNNTHVYKTYFLKTDAYMSKDHTWLRKYFPKAKSTTVDKKYRTK